MSNKWCMYKLENGFVVSRMFSPSEIPAGWFDSPKAARLGIKDWHSIVEDENIQKEKEAQRPKESELEDFCDRLITKQLELETLEGRLNVVAQEQSDRHKGLDFISAEQDARENLLDKRESSIKLKEAALSVGENKTKAKAKALGKEKKV